MQELPEIEPLLAFLARAQSLIGERPAEDPHQLERLIESLSLAHPVADLFSDGG
jgi:hypothetical protein